jgi:ubiquinone biosynthesis protein
MVDDGGQFTFIDTGAISHAPDKVRSALFGFFFHLAKGELDESFEAMLLMADTPPSGAAKEKYMSSMHEIYSGFIGKTVSEVSLTQQMMKTVRCAVLAGCRFGEEAFPIIRSLMYMDGMVLRGQPDVDLITSMGPYLDEFASIVELPYSDQKKTSQETTNSAFWNANLKPTD